MVTDRDRLEVDREITIAEIERAENKKRLAEERFEEWKMRMEEATAEVERLYSDLDDVDHDLKSRYGRAYAEARGYVI